ncbi:hypothetical protein D3C71_2037170 [compost metagenome]
MLPAPIDTLRLSITWAFISSRALRSSADGLLRRPGALLAWLLWAAGVSDDIPGVANKDMANSCRLVRHDWRSRPTAAWLSP